nr:hypothetical protein [Tanacetum cinerariifolium]
MQTRSSSRLVSNPSSNPTPFTNPNPKGRNRRRSKQRIEEFNLDELSPPIVMMSDQRTMAKLLQAPTEGYEDAIVVPAITADNFELKHGLLTLVQNKQFFGHDKKDPHAHIRYSNKITSTLKFLNILNTSIKLMLFPFSFKGAAQIWLEKEPSRSTFTWDDLVSKFINQLFPPSKTINLRNEITNFQQRIDESFNQDSLNSADGGNFLDKMPRECLAIIESKSKVRYSCNKPVVAKVSTNTCTFGISPDVAELKDMVKALLLDKKSQNQAPATVKAVEESYVTCVGAHSYRNCPATDGNIYRDKIQEFISQASAVKYNQGNTSYRPPMMSNQIRPPGFPPVPNNQNVQLNQKNNQNRFIQNQNRGNNFNHGPVYQPSVVENEQEATKDTVHPTNNGSTEDLQPPMVQTETLEIQISKPISEPINSPVSDPRPNLRPSIPYPSRMQDQKLRDKANDQHEKIFQIFKDLNFNISFADALILMPRFGPSIKSLLTNKDKLYELARTSLNEHCSTVLLKKLPEKLGDPELADRSISHPVGVAEDVYVKVGSFHFPTDFVVVDFDADPRVPLILERSFLMTRRALIDVFEANYSDMTAKRINIIDKACEEYSQEVLSFSDVIASGNPTPYYDPIVFTTSSTLTPFRNSDFLLEEVDAFLAIKDDPTSPEVDKSYLDPEGDILLLEAFLNDDPSLPPPNQGNYLPEVRKELKIC